MPGGKGGSGRRDALNGATVPGSLFLFATVPKREPVAADRFAKIAGPGVQCLGEAAALPTGAGAQMVTGAIVSEGAAGETPRGMVQGARLAPWQVKIAMTELAAQAHGRLRIADVAAVLQLSPTHFAKAFKNSVGVSPYDWFLRARIRRAMQMLRATDGSIAKIAAECGFTDQSHFTASFARAVGVTPGRWRRRLRAEADEPVQRAESFLLAGREGHAG